MEMTTTQQPTDIVFDAANAVVEYSVKEKALDDYKEKFAIVPSDLSIKENYALVAEGAALGRKMSGTLEKERKAQVADALEWQRKVNAKAKEIEARIAQIKDPLVEAKKAYDTKIEIEKREAAAAEERRLEAINDRIAAIKAKVELAISASSAAIAEMINFVSVEIETAPSWGQEFSGKAISVAQDTLSKLQEIHTMRQQHEEMVLQQEALAKAAAAAEQERKRQEQIELTRREAELDAERRRLAAERAELQRIRDEAMVTQEATAIHIPTAESIVRETAEAAPSPPEDHATKYRAAGSAMKAIIGDFATTKKLLDLIISGDIPHVQFNA